MSEWLGGSKKAAITVLASRRLAVGRESDNCSCCSVCEVRSLLKNLKVMESVGRTTGREGEDDIGKRWE